MRCPQCDHVNPSGARFCNACGTGLTGTCRACGQANAAGSRFCSNCGQALGPPDAAALPARFDSPGAYIPPHLAQRILASRETLQGERKQVTVLFADMKGSMELLADRDPEDARRLLDAVIERMMDAVHRYEGTVNQVLGDGIMALFGAPLAHENHAVRACYAALRMQEDVGRYGDEMQRRFGVPVQIRVGLNSGEVVVGSIGSDLRMEYSAVGQTTHLAARMEQMAKPSSVLLTVDTLRLAEGYVQAKALGPVPVRGLAEPVEVFELVGATAARTRLQVAAVRGLTRLVGRQAELGLLRQALDHARSGRGQVVALVGEAGVGKSRVAWEITRSHRTRDWLVLESSAASHDRATTWLPVIDLLRVYFRIEDGDGARTVREKLIGRLLALDETLRPTLGAFEALLEIPVEDAGWSGLDPATRQQRTVEAVKRLLLRESQVQPLLLVLEDLHWIDDATQALLDSLVESLPAARMVLLVNYRPEYQHAWGGKTYYSQLRLDPLPAETAEGMLDTLMGEDTALVPLKRVLIDRTQGNPFFLEETVRGLVENGALAGPPGDYRLATALPAIQVPATIQAVLAARIDRLPAEEKRLLQVASVVGKDVPIPLLRAVADLSEPDLRRALGRLQTAEFLYETRLFPDAEYTFRHALTLEVAYGGLLHERRRELHARIVDTLERMYPDRLSELAARLAHHAFRGEVWAKALTHLKRQTETAASRSSLDGVSGRDSVLGSPESAGALWWSGEYARAIEVGQRDLAVAAGFKNFGLGIVATCRLGEICHTLGDYGRATDYLRQAVASLKGDLEREHFGMASLPSVFARAWLSWCLAELGEFAEGIAPGEAAVAIAEGADHAYSQAVAAWGLGTLHVVRGDADRAIPILERGLVVTRMADVPLLFPFVAAPLGAAYAMAGRVSDAVPLLEQAVAQGAALNLLAGHALRLTWLGEALLGAGELERASEQSGQALTLADRLGERGSQAYARRLAGEIAMRQETRDVQAAATAYRDALQRATELRMRPLVARCRLGLAAVHRHAGAEAEARADQDAAVEALRAMQMTHWLGRVETLGAASR
jgi:class 3 adenylate cyclase/tetratricopeptide (TPR) repeat protein